MVAARKLYPGAALVFPGGAQETVRRFLAIYDVDLTRLMDLKLEEITRLILVDTQEPERLGPLQPLCIPCSRGFQTRRTIFLMRRDLKPGVIHPKGLADELMQLLPAMNLSDFCPIQLKMYQSDLRKRRQYDSGSRHRRCALIARNALAMLLSILSDLPLDQAIDQ